MPDTPQTPLMETATQAHEMYLAYRAAGFTSEEAIYVVTQLLVAVTLSASGFRPPGGSGR